MVVHHWESLVAERVGGGSSDDDGDMVQTTGRTIQERDYVQRQAEECRARLTVKAAFFYADDRMLVSTDPGWIQSTFDILTGLFDQVGLRKNVRKTVGMVCKPCWSARLRADESYTRRMMGEGRSFKER